jgi:hypothetical protein
MEQEPQRELQWYTLRRVAYWVRLSGKFLFVLVAAMIALAAFAVLLSN